MKWENVQVGQVLQVKDDELFPADLLCLYTALPDRVSPPYNSHNLCTQCFFTCATSVTLGVHFWHLGMFKD
jgi:hypothetical protein